jgi:hypothetical protein
MKKITVVHNNAPGILSKWEVYFNGIFAGDVYGPRTPKGKREALFTAKNHVVFAQARGEKIKNYIPVGYKEKYKDGWKK